MNNILYIGPYREFTGMGNAARKYIEALDISGFNVACRPIFNNLKPIINQELNNTIIKCEKNRFEYDTIIQHCYPHQLTYTNGYKNIGIVHIDSIGYGHDMYQYLDVMDEIWVGSTFSYDELIRLSIDTNKIKIVPELIDIDIITRYKNSHKREKQDKFMFYTIGDFIDKKNISMIILSFFILTAEFPNIGLLIKTKNKNSDSSDLSQMINYEINKIINSLKLPIDKNTYPVIISGETKYDNILYIHNNCDCYIDASSGESFGYPVLEAVSFNNQVIVNKNIGSVDIVRGTKFYGIDSTLEYSNGFDSQYYMYNSINQQNYVPKLNSLVLQMKRAILESATEKQERIDSQNNKILNYNINNIKKYL